MPDAHANFAYSTVATAPSPASSGTSLVVAAGQGALFPAVPFNAVVWPTGAQPLSSNAEIVRVTAISTDTLTITRTQESTAARTVVVGDQISAAITLLTLLDIERIKVAGGSTAYAVTAADCGKVVKQTGNSAANLAVTVAATAATLGDGFHFYLEHAGGGTSAADKKLVFTPTTSTVDGAASITDYPGALRLVRSDGSNWETELLRGGYVEVKVADSPFTLTTPKGWTRGRADVVAGGASGGGGRSNTAATSRPGGGAGGGGKRNTRNLVPSDMGASITCTIGAGAASVAAQTHGIVGNNTTLGTIATAYAGGGGARSVGGPAAGGGGGGASGVGATVTGSSGGTGGACLGTTSGTENGGAGGNGGNNGNASWNGGGGAAGGSESGGGAGGQSRGSAGGGGGGGGLTAADAAANGGAGGGTGVGTVVGGTGDGGAAGTGTAGAAGGTGDSPTDLDLMGEGGGGGAPNAGGTAGRGGDGGFPGGGGGGGGGGLTGGASGAGGDGCIRFWYWP